jgi:hypothetical protein
MPPIQSIEIEIEIAIEIEIENDPAANALR